MDKNQLLSFIEKYNLGKEIEAVKWKSVNKSLSTRFVGGDKNVLGELTLHNFDFEDAEIGIMETSNLVKLLSVLEDEVEMNILEKNGKNVSLKIEDNRTSLNYVLANLAIIPKVPGIKQLPEWDVEITLDSENMDRIVKAQNALDTNETFTILTDTLSGECNLVLGYSTINSNRVNFDVESNFDTEIDPISFKAGYLSEILKANNEADEAVLKISEEGLCYIGFAVGDFLVDYYLVSVKIQ